MSKKELKDRLYNISISLPFVYFYVSRIKRPSALLVPAFSEWLLGLLILMYFNYEPKHAFEIYLTGYLAFISFYEIGYIFNDFYSVKLEENPRIRHEYVKKEWVTIWVILKFLFFLFFSYLLGYFRLFDYWFFYFALLISFLLHNIIRNKELKIFTFLNLAFLRFFAPIIFAVKSDEFLRIVPGVFLSFLLYRVVSYMNSKDILLMEGREKVSFKLGYYSILLILSALISYMSHFPETIYINLYFIAGWLALLVFQSKSSLL